MIHERKASIQINWPMVAQTILGNLQMAAQVARESPALSGLGNLRTACCHICGHRQVAQGNYHR